MNDATIGKVALVGGAGRLGSALSKVLSTQGIDYQTVPRGITSDTPPMGQVIFECASAEGTQDALVVGKAWRCPVCIVSSGHSQEDMLQIRQSATAIPVVKIDNLSLGFEMQRRFAKLLVGSEGFTEFSIHDRHPATKTDAPSGTAKQLAALCDTRTITYSREGAPVADHTIVATSAFETIEITHRVHTIEAAAHGALRVLRAMAELTKPGLYTFEEGKCLPYFYR